MSNPLEGKVIVTTASKVKLLRKLRDFMAMKSIMMQAKRNPKLMSDPQFLARAMEYLKTNTEFANLPFWVHLSEMARLKAAQYLTLQEISDTTMMRMVSSKNNAALFVILSGSAEVKHGEHGEERMLGPGDMFGHADIFHDAINNLGRYAKMTGDERVDDSVISVKMHRGTFMRLSLLDMCRYVLDEESVFGEKIEPEEYCRIAEIDWADLTADDKFYVHVYLRVRKLVGAQLFAFLDSYKLVPKNARTPAFRLYQEYERGRMITLRRSDPEEVYIVVDGNVKIEIEARRSEGNEHKVSCKRKGRKPMVIKTTSMPIMQYSAGAVILIRAACHDVGILDERPKKEVFKMPPAIPTPSFSSSSALSRGAKGKTTRKSSTTTKNAHQQGGENAMDSQHPAHDATHHHSHTVSSSSSHDQNRSKTSEQRVNRPMAHPPLYHINLTFESKTSMLKIPYQSFERILGDERKIMKTMAEEIKSQLNHANNTVLDRIKKLESWIQGGISFSPDTFAHVEKSLDEHANLVNTSVPHSNETALPPIGSFNLSQTIEKETDSSIESTLSFSQTSQKNGSSPAWQDLSPSKNSSKLKGIIAKMKTTAAPSTTYVTNFVPDGGPQFDDESYLDSQR